MTFYFKPPRGTITLQALEQCVSERIKYLKKVESIKNIADFEEPVEFQYLTDGSALDRAGHYMLRLLSLTEENVHHFLHEYEPMLFEKRLKCLDPLHIQLELRTVRRHLEEIQQDGLSHQKYDDFVHTFLYVCQELTQRHISYHAFSSDHLDTCEDHSLQVPFTACLSLVRKREVELKKGIATVPCGKWQSLLVCLFKIHLDLGMYQLRRSRIQHKASLDSRIQHVSKMCQPLYTSSNKCSNVPGIKSQDVDSESTLFPPCMLKLHKNLRMKHRLSHDARFHYSLFLKDIGMPIEEAVEFWRGEYVKTSSGCTGCSHSWQNDNRRYVYNIRHLYGLEGARKNYPMPSCRKIQGLVLGPIAEGGCPFQHSDEDKLHLAFPDIVANNKETVASLTEINKEKGPQAACREYHSIIHKLVQKNAVGKSENCEFCSQLEENPAGFYKSLLSK